MQLTKLIFIVLSISAFVAHEFPADTQVKQLDDSNFKQVTGIGSDGPSENWFLMLYAPWCGHCKRLIPTWNDLPTLAQGKYNTAAVNCDNASEVKGLFEVRGFPTLILVSSEGKYYKYSGPRTANELNVFAQGGYLSQDAFEPNSNPSSGTQALIWLEKIGAIPIAIAITLFILLICVCVFGMSSDETPEKKTPQSQHTKQEKKRL